MSEVRVRIFKEDANSVVLDESISVVLDDKVVAEYLNLVKQTWPQTRINTSRKAA